MLTDKFPILEFDGESRELIDVRKNINEGQQLPEKCVITFFGNVVKDFVRVNHCKRIGSLIMETFELDIYEYAAQSQKIAFMHGLGSGPHAAGQIEKLSAMGCKKFIACGGCGVLERILRLAIFMCRYRPSATKELHIIMLHLRERLT